MYFEKHVCLKRKLFQLLIFPYRQTWVTQVQGLVVAEKFMSLSLSASTSEPKSCCM